MGTKSTWVSFPGMPHGSRHLPARTLSAQGTGSDYSLQEEFLSALTNPRACDCLSLWRAVKPSNLESGCTWWVT